MLCARQANANRAAPIFQRPRPATAFSADIPFFEVGTVAIVKLSSMATVLPGPALWAFIGLTVLLTSVLSFDPRSFWEMAFAPASGRSE